MARIMIENLFKKTLVVADYNKTLLRHFQDNYIDWMHACGGKGRCTTCKLIVLEGAECFGDLTLAEQEYLRQGELKPGERLACQAKIRGNVSLVVPGECQLPHITYSDQPLH
jgi:2Fe-2S ferredoxin